MKRLFYTGVLLVLSYAFSLDVLAQDVIVKTDGEEIEAKVIEIGLSEIKYKRFDNPEGPIIVITKSDVFKINYENGTYELITSVGLNNKSTIKYSKRREPGWSFLMSFLYPGLGQFYNKQAGKGIAMVIGSTVGLTLFIMYADDGGRWLPGLGYAGFWLWSVIDAPVSSGIINKKYGLSGFNIINNNKFKMCLNPNIKPVNYSFAQNYQDYRINYGASLTINFK